MHICVDRQVAHITPLTPQLVCEGGKQTSPRQQPAGHVWAEHAVPTQAPLRQVWPVVQARQSPASAPQARVSLPARHAPSGSMQPLHAALVHRPASQR